MAAIPGSVALIVLSGPLMSFTSLFSGRRCWDSTVASRDLMIVLSIVEPVVLVLCLAVGLNQVRKRLVIISTGLGDLGGMLATVESQHLRPLNKLVNDINGPLNTINATLPGIAAKAALVVRKATGG